MSKLSYTVREIANHMADLQNGVQIWRQVVAVANRRLENLQRMGEGDWGLMMEAQEDLAQGKAGLLKTEWTLEEFLSQEFLPYEIDSNRL